MKIKKEEALFYHNGDSPGKLEIKPKKPFKTQRDLSLAYTPGVAFPCLEIKEDPIRSYDYTIRSNLVGVVTNGTAVLGLGDIGSLASKPVMEGKALLFKRFAGIDVFDIEIDEKDPDKFCEVVKKISPTFGAINLEDIKAPECFYIEKKLKEELDIPVMHDDQHGTAIVSAAALLNAIEITGKDISQIRLVINGAGAAAIACGRLYRKLGVKNIIMLDSKGVISKKRDDLPEHKKEFATDENIRSLKEAMYGADVFIGLSKGNILSKNMVLSMNEEPIIFALANPTPEIFPEDVYSVRDDAIVATGRSDYPNQINNVIAFPFIFRGALDTRAESINDQMILSAIRGIAELAKKEVPEEIKEIYESDLRFGRDYIIPKPFDHRLLIEVPVKVAEASLKLGVARVKDFDLERYREDLKKLSYELLSSFK
ncbi:MULTISPECIES: malic enzyme-like NAD(P)-binding protein [Persephonella]|uniref:NADP-dependent malic enzyme n=1 Tax=Persephonella marina (strain DSM 14350 / EX-H1) TaxID=123214 RepID=C0QS04_PERMH|nr:MULTISPECIES: malic enzyme-like NAD(P)-binding protein [Persephonella]ACO03787.1 NADP-dependent malic enzyme [Persephonella marina EX-H1]